MELRQLRAFSAVVETGTFRAAAARLHLTQPALWQQVRSLQDALGVVLFERAGRRVRVTKSGAQLLERVEAVLGAADRLTELATAIHEGTQGIVTLACPAPPIQLMLARVLGEFSRTRPHVRVDIRDLSAAGQSPIDALASGAVDLAVAPRHEGLDGFRLFKVHVVVVVSRDHPWTRLRRVDIRRLRGEPLLTAPAGSLSRGLLESACGAAGFAPTVRLENASPAMLVALAENGFGTAVLASDAIVGTGATAPINLWDVDGGIGTEAWLHWRRGAELAPSARELVQCIRRRAEK